MIVMSLSHWEGLFASTTKPARPSRSGFSFCVAGNTGASSALHWRRRGRLEPPAPLTEPPVAEEGPNLAPAPFVRIGPGFFCSSDGTPAPLAR
jgi:hypothetical protein